MKWPRKEERVRELVTSSGKRQVGAKAFGIVR